MPAESSFLLKIIVLCSFLGCRKNKKKGKYGEGRKRSDILADVQRPIVVVSTDLVTKSVPVDTASQSAPIDVASANAKLTSNVKRLVDVGTQTNDPLYSSALSSFRELNENGSEEWNAVESEYSSLLSDDGNDSLLTMSTANNCSPISSAPNASKYVLKPSSKAKSSHLDAFCTSSVPNSSCTVFNEVASREAFPVAAFQAAPFTAVLKRYGCGESSTDLVGKGNAAKARSSAPNANKNVTMQSSKVKSPPVDDVFSSTVRNSSCAAVKEVVNRKTFPVAGSRPAPFDAVLKRHGCGMPLTNLVDGSSSTKHKGGQTRPIQSVPGQSELVSVSNDGCSSDDISSYWQKKFFESTA